MSKTIDIMQDYIYLLHELFIVRLNEIKKHKKGLGKNYVLAAEAQWLAISDGWLEVTKDKKFMPLYDNIQWYTLTLNNKYRELLSNNPKPEKTGGSQYDIAIQKHWEARELVCLDVARNGGFFAPSAGRPRKLVNDNNRTL